ncbi:MAG: glycosyltransferase [Sphaerochaeta sp.]|nr:glycosyltransferase [Sphaerochaeta sp.]
MKIWIIAEGEPLPIPESKGRLMRAGMLAKQFSEIGSLVTWWSSTYLHYEKRYVSDIQKTIKINSNLLLNLLHSSNGYQRNISVKRIKYSNDLAKKFKKQSMKENKPDIIYCSWPLIDFAYEAVKFGHEFNIPVVIDIRDFWPDIFIQPFPKRLQPIVKLGISCFLRRKVSYVMKSATSVVGVIPKALGFAKSYGRILQEQDHVVHLAYDNTPVSTEESSAANILWENYGLQKDKCIVSYVGSISNRIGDFDTLIEAAKKCEDPSVIFIFCGTGNYFAELTERCKDLKNVIIPGYRNRAEIQALLKLSTFGLLAYRNTDDFIDSLPSKFSEYLSQGLIILTSLRGASRQILEKENCGTYYQDASSLLECITRIYYSTLEKEQMTQNALNLFHREFDASQVYSDFYKFLEATAVVVKNKG